MKTNIYEELKKQYGSDKYFNKKFALSVFLFEKINDTLFKNNKENKNEIINIYDKIQIIDENDFEFDDNIYTVFQGEKEVTKFLKKLIETYYDEEIYQVVPADLIKYFDYKAYYRQSLKNRTKFLAEHIGKEHVIEINNQDFYIYTTDEED